LNKEEWRASTKRHTSYQNSPNCKDVEALVLSPSINNKTDSSTIVTNTDGKRECEVGPEINLNNNNNKIVFGTHICMICQRKSKKMEKI
jgi:hypothetical protein